MGSVHLGVNWGTKLLDSVDRGTSDSDLSPVIYLLHLSITFGNIKTFSVNCFLPNNIVEVGDQGLSHTYVGSPSEKDNKKIPL